MEAAFGPLPASPMGLEPTLATPSRLHVHFPRHFLLLRSFVFQQLHSRYAASLGGSLWFIIHPFAQVAVYTFLFHVIFKVRFHEATEGTSSFLLFFLTGFFPWMPFSEALDRGCRAVVDNAALVTKVAFPSAILPLATTLASFLLNGIGILGLACYLGLTRGLSPAYCLLPIIVALQLLFTAGLALFLAALTVFFRDTHEILRIALTVWFYATPILYPPTFVPDSYRWLVHINPMTHFVQAYRHIFFFSGAPWTLWGFLCCFSILFWTLGLSFFRRSQKAFGDVL